MYMAPLWSALIPDAALSTDELLAVVSVAGVDHAAGMSGTNTARPSCLPRSRLGSRCS